MDDDARTEEEDRKLFDKCLAVLSEHFENVHIFASKLNHGGKSTTTFQRGIGNWFARYGQIRNFVIKEEEAFRVASRIDARQHEEDGTNSDEDYG